MPEFDKRVDKSASENAKPLKHLFKFKMKILKDKNWEKQSIAWPVPQDSKAASCRHSHHQQVKKS